MSTSGSDARSIRTHLLMYAAAIVLPRIALAGILFYRVAASERALLERHDALHRIITKSGHAHRANRVVALLSKMFNLAILWGWRADNPAKGVERNREEKRHRYLSGNELNALTAALAALDDRQAANIVRLLLLTGARRGEVLSMKWADLHLDTGAWTKPGATTKQKTLHRVPLSAPAHQLLAALRAEADKAEKPSPYVFPSRYDPSKPRENVKGAWADLCKSAGLLATKKIDETSEERSFAKNGIWMCRDHGNAIASKDPEFTAERLREWQKHTVRGAIAGALKKKLGLDVKSENVGGRGRVYRIAG
jgi:integrase